MNYDNVHVQCMYNSTVELNKNQSALLFWYFASHYISSRLKKNAFRNKKEKFPCIFMFSMFKEMSLTFFWIINLTYFLSLVCAHTFCDFYKFNVNSGPEDNANKIQVRTKPNRNSPSPCIIFQEHFVQKRPLYVRKYKLHSLDTM